MTLAASGSIAISEIADEAGKADNTALDTLHAAYVADAASFPNKAAGDADTFSFSEFYSARYTKISISPSVIEDPTTEDGYHIGTDYDVVTNVDASLATTTGYSITHDGPDYGDLAYGTSADPTNWTSSNISSYRPNATTWYTASRYNICIARSSQVLLPNGDLRAAEDLQIGEEVQTHSLPGMLDESDPDWRDWTTTSLLGLTNEITEVVGIKPTTKKVTLISINGSLTCTHTHVLFVKKRGIWGWVNARNVRVGDYIVKDGVETPVIHIDRFVNETTVYSFDMEPFDGFIADGIFSHNAKYAGPYTLNYTVSRLGTSDTFQFQIGGS